MIKSKEDIGIVYYYLSKLFKCIFKCSYFEDYIINPEVIELLFGEAKQFYVQNCNISAQDYNIDILMQFILNNLVSEYHRLSFWIFDIDTLKNYKNDLFKILLCGGDKFRKEVYVTLFSTPGFTKDVYNYIVEVSYLTGVNPENLHPPKKFCKGISSCLDGLRGNGR
ncbi:unnamed protein product [Meloidogyne enterolobii]|uniref:Uncharacterized protein n=1 Tax=Meloidogyne enterolobii TaxID=390850 RepID=A0ACB0ZD93_MELEN